MAEDLFSGFEDIYSDKGDWWEEPLTFREFTESPEHMNIKLTDVQYSWFEDLLGPDPKKVFTEHRVKNVMAILAGKGSGKDLCTSNFLNWVFYLLLCMENPTDYFGLLGPEEKIDIVNVAQNQGQSIRVFFKRFTDRIKRWPWLKKHYQIEDHKKILNPELTEPRDTVHILDASLTLDNNPIRFWSLHSGSQSYEGFNILCFVIDEGSAFPNYVMYDKDGNEIIRSRADDMLDVLKSSAESRNWEWFGFLISYPREKNCFQMRMYREGQEEDSNIMSCKYSQFECLPPSKYSGEWVEWQGYRIPKERLKTAKKDPADFKLKYLCEVEETARKFFNKAFVDEVFDSSLQFIGEFQDEVKETENHRLYTYKYLDHWNNHPMYDYVLAGDYSTVNDRTSMAIGHAIPIEQTDPALKGFDKKVIIDLILMWQPDKKKGILVSHASIRECLKEILYHFNIVYASLDQLESALTLEDINTIGITADKHNINDDDYRRCKNLVEAGLLVCPPYPLLKDEFNNVEYFPKRHRVDHTSDGSKDVLDTICQVCREIYTKNIFSDVKMEVGANPFAPQYNEDEKVNPNDWSALIPNFVIR